MYKFSDNLIFGLWTERNWIAGSEWEEEDAAGPFLLSAEK